MPLLFMLFLMMGNNTFTLKVPRFATEHVKIASLPTGNVTWNFRERKNEGKKLVHKK